MGPSPQEMPIVNRVSTATETTNHLWMLVDSSTQTTATFDASNLADSSVQTDFETCCKCRCPSMKCDVIASGTVAQIESKVNKSSKSKMNRTVTASIAKIPCPPPLPLPLLNTSLPSNVFLNSFKTPTSPIPPPLPGCLDFSTPINPTESALSSSQSPVNSDVNFITLPPPPLLRVNGSSTFPCMKPASGIGLLMRKFNTLPQANLKLRTLNWTKVPKQKIAKSLWSNGETQPPVFRVDFDQMKELFCQKPTKKSFKIKSQGSSVKSLASRSVNLLDSQRSFLINIFLKQFKQNVEFVFESIEKGVGLSAEKLKALIKLLPDSKEIAEIKAHSNESLGEAENFFLHLSEISDYELRVRAMLSKEEFDERFSSVSAHLDKIINSCAFLINDSSLRQFLTLVLQLGNQLNAGTYAGNAVGFKLSTLPMLADTKSNKPKMNFLHYVVDVASSNDSSLLQFRTKAADFQEMSKTPIASIEEEVASLSNETNEMNKLLKSSNISTQFGDFFQNAKKNVDVLLKKVKSIKEMKAKLAVHFCEDPTSFQLDECYVLFANFFQKVNIVLEENEKMKKIEEQAARMKVIKEISKERHVARRNILFQDEVDIVTQLMRDIETGDFKLRKTKAKDKSRLQLFS